MKKYLVLFFIVFIGLTASAQVFVKASIIDSITNKPLKNANVNLEDNIGYSSDKNGQVSFYISQKNSKFTISYLGYKTKYISIPLKDTSLVIYLVPNYYFLNYVNISSNRATDVIDNTPQRIINIPRASINNDPSYNVENILSNVSGVNINRGMGIFDSQSAVSLRGLSGNDQGRTLITIDGVPVNKSDGGSVNWNMFAGENISEIQVVKGASSTYYGSNAMGGVININTVVPNYKFKADVMLEYGTYNTFSSKINLGGKINHKKNTGFYWGLNALYRQSDGYISVPEWELYEYSVPNYLNEISGGAKIGYIISPDSKIELDYKYYDDKRGSGEKVYEEDGAYKEHDTHNFRLKYSDSIAKGLLSVSTYMLFEDYHKLSEYMDGRDYSFYEANAIRRDAGIIVNYFIKHKNNNISMGANYKNGYVNGSDIYYTSTDEIHNTGQMNFLSAYIYDELLLLKNKMNISFGIRFNYASFNKGRYYNLMPSARLEYLNQYINDPIENDSWMALSPKIGVHYWFTKNIRVFASASRGFSPPKLDDMTRTGSQSGSFKVLNPQLDPEYITSYEIGADFKTLKKRLIFSPSIYYSKGKDFMYTISTGDTVKMGYSVPVVQTQNISEVEIFGAELDINYRVGQHLNAYLNFAYSRGQILKYDSLYPSDVNLEGKFLTDVPDFISSAGIVYINKYASFNIRFNYIGKRWSNDENISVENEFYTTPAQWDPYYTIDIRLWRLWFDKYTTAINISNLFDTEIIKSYNYIGPGRMISFQLGYKI